MIRTLLNRLYLASGAVAAGMMIGLGGTILVQIVARLFGYPFDGIEVSSFFLAGMSFMGLAYTWRRGRHLRITLLLSTLQDRQRRAFEVITCLAAVSLCAYLTYNYVLFAIESFAFGYKSRGLVAVPLWIPQTSLAVGLVVFLIALADDAIAVLRGRTPSYLETAERSTHSE